MGSKKTFRAEAIQRVKAEMQRDYAAVFVADDVESKLKEDLLRELNTSGVPHLIISAEDSVLDIAKKIIESGAKKAVILDCIDHVSEANIDEFVEFVAHRKLSSTAYSDIAALSLLMIDRSGDGYSFAILQRCTLVISDGEINEIPQGSGSAIDSEVTMSLVVGYIPPDWKCASNGSKKIMVGDVDDSRTSELQYRITNEDWHNLSSGKKLSGDLNNHYSEMTRDSRTLSDGEKEIPPGVFKNIHEIILEETELHDGSLVLVEEGVDYLVNTKERYQGNFYCYYIEERSDETDSEILREVLFVVKGV
jgi:hypothetical protein